MNHRAQQLIQDLSLAPHPEGGYFHEVFRSRRRVTTKEGNLERSALTAIYFLLVREQPNHWHVIQSDEIWHFYEGDPLNLYTIDPETMELERRRLGSGFDNCQSVAAVPAGYWQVAASSGDYSLVGCSVGPGFEFDDFRMLRDDRAAADRLAAVLPEMAKHL